MVSYKEAGKMLDKAMEALPTGIFDGLNGGVNLIEEAKADSKGGYILGLYHNNMMGRYVEIFYGSFAALYGDIPAMQFERRLKSTLHHELTHHIEALAGDRSLEQWDELQDIIWEEMDAEEGIFVGSMLFVDDDDTALAPAAKAFFEMYAAERCPGIPAESAGIFSAGEALQPDCRAAAEALGADFSAHKCKALTEELFEKFDAVMCMTLAQMDELSERFPGSERKLFCADETDILRPKLRFGWKKAVERIHAVVNEETLELQLEDSGASPNRVAEEDIQIIRLDSSAPKGIIESILEIEKCCFSLPISREQLLRQIENENRFIYAAVCGELAMGYISAQRVLDELDIFNVAVANEFRRQHIGQALLEKLLETAKALREEGELERITLEVRFSNDPAIALYQKYGFEEVGRRKNYYEKPREDAVLMDLVL